MRLLVSTHETDHIGEDRDVLSADRDSDHALDRTDSAPNSNPAVETDSGSEESTHPDTLYSVSVTPDLQYGLGLRLDVRDNAIIVDSFKRHPVSDLPLGCEASMLIDLQDELVSINSHSLSGASLPSVIQTIRSVVQNSRGLAVVLVLQRASKSAPAGDVEGNQSDFKAERNLLACPYYFWRHCCIIDLETHCCSSSAERLISADIGYDAHRKEVIVGTLKTRTEGLPCFTSVMKTSTCLHQVHLSLGVNGEVSLSKGTLSLLCSHELTTSNIGQQCATLQLWRDTSFSPLSTPLPLPLPVPVPVPTSTVYASVVLQPTQSYAAPSNGRNNAEMELSTCCTLTVIKMTYSTNHSVSPAHAHTQGVESSVRVVTSSLPQITAPNGAASFAQDLSAQSYRSNGKTQPSILAPPREIQFQLLTCPIRTAGTCALCSQYFQKCRLTDAASFLSLIY